MKLHLLGDIWETLELKAMVGQLCLNNSCDAHLIGHEIHHKSCVISHLLGYTYLRLPLEETIKTKTCASLIVITTRMK